MPGLIKRDAMADGKGRNPFAGGLARAGICSKSEPGRLGEKPQMNRKILVMGLPGSGKTTLTRALAPMLNAVVFNNDEVRANIPPELAPLWERVKGSIRASSRRSRTEAFLQYVEENPRAAVEAVEETSERRLLELLAKRDSAERFAQRRRYTKAELADVPF